MRHSHPKIFLSYAHHDSEFVYKLQADLESRGADVWLDVKHISVGDSISESVEKALERMDFFCLVISQNSLKRKWVQREYRAALTLQLSRNGKKPRILPLMKDIVSVPLLLRDIRWADFATNYNIAFESLCSTIGLHDKLAPFLKILPFLGSDEKERIHRLKHINTWTISELAEIMKESGQQALYELRANSSSGLQTILPENIPHFIKEDHNLRAIVKLPTIHMGNYHVGDDAGGDNIPIISCSIEGMEPFVKALSTFTKEVRQRRIYLLPGSINFHWPGPMDGFPIDELIEFETIFIKAAQGAAERTDLNNEDLKRRVPTRPLDTDRG